MPSTTRSTLFDTLTPIQVQVLQSLVAGFSVTAAAQEVGIHRTAVHLWTRTLPDFARAYLTLRQQRADRLVDELGDLAINTFRQLLSDESASASVRLKAAFEIVKIVEAQRPTTLSTALAEKMPADLCVAEIITHRRRQLARNTSKSGAMRLAPAAVPSNTSAVAATLSAKPGPLENKYRETNPAISFKTMPLGPQVRRVPEPGKWNGPASGPSLSVFLH